MCREVANGFGIKDNILIQLDTGGTQALFYFSSFESRCTAAPLSLVDQVKDDNLLSVNACLQLEVIPMNQIKSWAPCWIDAVSFSATSGRDNSNMSMWKAQGSWPRLLSSSQEQTEGKLIHVLQHIRAAEQSWWASEGVLLAFSQDILH